MRLFIIAFAFICSSTLAFEEPARFVLLNPEFLLETSWSHQVAYQSLQTDIDASFVEINKIVAEALVIYSRSAIQRYDNHTQDVLTNYDPKFDEINTLPLNECRNTALALLKNAVIYSGYLAANCSEGHSIRVHAEANKAADILAQFTGEYGQVVLNVYQSFLRMNAMVQSEQIEANINGTFQETLANWNAAKPAVNDLRTTLNNNLNVLSGQLQVCFNNTYDYVVQLMVYVQSQIEVCRTWPTSRGNRAVVERSDQFKDYTEEFNEFVAKIKPFEWQ